MVKYLSVDTGKESFFFSFLKKEGVAFPNYALDHPVCCWHPCFEQFKVTLLPACSNCLFQISGHLSLFWLGWAQGDFRWGGQGWRAPLLFREVSTLNYNINVISSWSQVSPSQWTWVYEETLSLFESPVVELLHAGLWCQSQGNVALPWGEAEMLMWSLWEGAGGGREAGGSWSKAQSRKLRMWTDGQGTQGWGTPCLAGSLTLPAKELWPSEQEGYPMTTRGACAWGQGGWRWIVESGLGLTTHNQTQKLSGLNQEAGLRESYADPWGRDLLELWMLWDCRRVTQWLCTTQPLASLAKAGQCYPSDTSCFYRETCTFPRSDQTLWSAV